MQVLFPLIVSVCSKTHEFATHKELYDFYYLVPPPFLKDFSRPFWALGINLTELVHFPERFK